MLSKSSLLSVKRGLLKHNNFGYNVKNKKNTIEIKNQIIRIVFVVSWVWKKTVVYWISYVAVVLHFIFCKFIIFEYLLPGV